MVEQRDKRRQKTLMHGYVYFDDSPCAVECIVREISETGARLQFETPQLPVEAFELDIPLRGQKLRAEVKWQRDNEIGVVFAGAMDATVAPTAAAPAAQALTEDLAMRVLRLENEIAALQHVVKRLQLKVANKIEAA
jgi:hypothetical protein